MNLQRILLSSQVKLPWNRMVNCVRRSMFSRKSAVPVLIRTSQKESNTISNIGMTLHLPHIIQHSSTSFNLLHPFTIFLSEPFDAGKWGSIILVNRLAEILESSLEGLKEKKKKRWPSTSVTILRQAMIGKREVTFLSGLKMLQLRCFKML